MKVPYGALAAAPATLDIRCERKHDGRRCGRLVAQVLPLGGKLVMLQAPHEVPTYKWPERYDFDGSPVKIPDGWSLETTIILGLDRHSNAKRRSHIKQAPESFRYDLHEARNAEGEPPWRADIVGTEPLLLASVCCREVRVLSGDRLKSAFRRSATSVDCDTVLYSGDAKQFIAAHL